MLSWGVHTSDADTASEVFQHPGRDFPDMTLIVDNQDVLWQLVARIKGPLGFRRGSGGFLKIDGNGRSLLWNGIDGENAAVTLNDSMDL